MTKPLLAVVAMAIVTTGLVAWKTFRDGKGYASEPSITVVPGSHRPQPTDAADDVSIAAWNVSTGKADQPVTVIVPGVTFNPELHAISPEGTRAIEGLATTLAAYPNLKVVLLAGGRGQLSFRRARNVYLALARTRLDVTNVDAAAGNPTANGLSVTLSRTS